MKVIHINAKSKSPKNDINNNNRLLLTKNKNSSKNAKLTKTRNLDFSSNNTKKKDIFKRIFPHNNYIHFSSNNCTSTNTTNFNNSKTNNFIFFENDFNFKDAEKFKQQIDSLIKHNSSNNCSNIKFINNNYRRDKDKKKRRDIFSNNLKIHSKEDNHSDMLGINKNDKLYINTNYSILLNNTKKEREKNKKICTKIQNYKNCINFYNSRPLTLNFSNELNNYNSYKMLLNNKSMKYLHKHKPNYRKKSGNNENTSKIKRKGNSENKERKKKDLLIDNKRINGSKSYNILFIHKRNNLSKSTSFSPIHDIKNKKKDNRKNATNLKQLKNNKSLIGMKNSSIERVQINLYNKKNNNSSKKNNVNSKKINSLKTSDNQINFQFFNKIDNKNVKIKKNANKARGVINSQKSSPYYAQKINKNKVDIKSKNIFYKINADYDARKEKNNNNNNTFIEKNKTSIITPEQNHFLAIKQIQQIKNNNNIFK